VGQSCDFIIAQRIRDLGHRGYASSRPQAGGFAGATELEILWRRTEWLARQIDSLRLGICRITCADGTYDQHQSDSGEAMKRCRRNAPYASKEPWKDRLDSGHAASLAKNRTRFLGMSPGGEIAFPMKGSKASLFKLSIARHGTRRSLAEA
jgi:hypothetical protein